MQTSLRLVMLAALLPVVPGLATAQTVTLVQDASTVGVGKAEITPAFGAMSASGDGETVHLFNAFSTQVRVGVAERVDVFGSYSRLQASYGGVHMVGFGAKVSLMQGVAVAVPVTMLVGSDVDTGDSVVVEPTVIGTVPLGSRVDFTPSFGVLLPACERCDAAYRTGIGFGIRAGERVTLRPELGIITEPGAGATLWSVGIGVSVADRR